MTSSLWAHRVVTVSATLAVVLGGGVLLWGPAVRERRALLDQGPLSAGSEAVPVEARRALVRLALLGADGRTLEEEAREVTLRRSVPAAARVVLEELLAGSRQGRGAVLPPGVRVRHVFLDRGGVAYVDLSAEVLPPASEGEAGESVVRGALAVAASLGMSLPEIAQVRLLVEGREVPVVADGIDLRRPLPAALPPRPVPPT